jgi:ribosomal protein S14
MLKLIGKNKQLLNKNKINAVTLYVLKIFLFDNYLQNFLNRQKIKNFGFKKNKSSSSTFFKKNCYHTGRTRSTIGLTNLSRHKFKQLAWGGLLVGVKKFS